MARRIPNPASVLAARERRLTRVAGTAKRDQWFIEEVANAVNLTAKKRVRIATEWLRNKVVKNISIPVVRSLTRGGRVVVTERSSPGEFPRADTTLLMKTIFGEVIDVSPGIYDGVVGTPVDYGLILEIEKDRPFLTRTFYEELSNLKRILGEG